MSPSGYQTLVMKASRCGIERQEDLAGGKRVVRKGKETKNNVKYGNLGKMTKLAIHAISQCPTASCPKRPFKYELWIFMFNSTSDCSSIEGKLFAPDEFLRLSFLFLLHLPLSPTFSFISWDKYRCRQFIVDMFHDKRPKQERDKSCQKCNKKRNETFFCIRTLALPEWFSF